MKANEIRAELIRRGIRLVDVAKMCNTSRQMVWLAIRSKNGKKGKTLIIKKKISELIEN